MLKYALLCGLLALNLSGALAESDMICRLTDAPSQCGAFCLSALAPVYNTLRIPHNLANSSYSSKANEVLVGQHTLESQLTALQDNQASIKVALTSLQDMLASIKVPLDAQARYLANNEQNFTKRLDGLESRLSDQEAKVLKGVTKIKYVGFQRIGSKYYYIEQESPKNWSVAAETCRSMGGNLADIRDAADLAAIQLNLKVKTNYWLGISDLANKNQFISLSTAKKVPYWHWVGMLCGSTTNPPNCNCVVLRDGKMYADGCYRNNLFICQTEG
ncbi:uncharacterized protein LOC6526496 [Drosophila yakuba]|uniref:C-type lectin domain-containing protein n=1 Tax=Drosophila yakuba TaxID=7245 RepID=A0A0R1DQA6_DROYA|nr:uncharacterized protein LOC6526496 [Drosophila yakuba]KRJ97113.1 uncharacterized protein Dyak_GE15246 [Drosophila yakuba]